MFHRLGECTSAEWKPIMKESMAFQLEMPDRVLALLRQTAQLKWSFPVDQLTHMLQSATLAERDNATDEVIFAALCHDIGKVFSIRNHASIGAEMLRSYVSPDVYNVLLTHQHFQARYTADHLTASGIPCDGEMRARYVDEPWYELATQFVDDWDEKAFDPSFATKPLEHFEPLVRSICEKPRYPTMG